MKSKFLSAVAVLAFAALAAPADDKPRFYLEDGKVVERFAAVESDVSKLKADVAALTKTVADLKAGIVTIAEAGPGELGTGPVTIPLTPVKAAPCICGAACTCEDKDKCPGACPTQPVSTGPTVKVPKTVCVNGKCVTVWEDVPAAAAPATYSTVPNAGCCGQPAAPQFSAPAAAAFGGGRPVFFPRAHGFFQAHRPHLFGRLFRGGCCGG